MTSSPGEYTASLPRKRMGAGVLFTNQGGQVLLVEPTYKDHWEIPGGTVEADESPYTAAVRETQEELGLLVTPGRLLTVDWVPPQDGRTEAINFIYTAAALDPADEDRIRLPADELRSWAWCTPAEANTRLSPLLARRVEASLQVLEQGGTRYLENGHPVG